MGSRDGGTGISPSRYKPEPSVFRSGVVYPQGGITINEPSLVKGKPDLRDPAQDLEWGMNHDDTPDIELSGSYLTSGQRVMRGWNKTFSTPVPDFAKPGGTVGDYDDGGNVLR